MAKFNVGDVVKILAGSKAGKIGRVESSAPGPQGGEMYHIRLDDGILTDAAERNISLANSRACNGVRSRNAVVQKALNACARNYAYSHDPIKLMIQYAKKEDYGGIMDLTNPEEAESMGLYPADLVRRVYAKASKYYAGGRNAATPAQTQELVGLISSLRVKGINACARNGGIDDFKVGDRVMVRSVVGFTPTDPKPGTVTAIYKSDNRIAVKKDDGGRGLFDASMVTKNACGTARNANLTPQYITSQLKDLISMMKSVKMEYGKVKESDRSIKKKLTALGDSMREDRKVYDSAPESDKRAWDSTYNEILNTSPFGPM